MDINGAFKSTCRLLFGKEVGELSMFGPYLSSYMEKIREAKSIDWKEVYYTAPYHPKAKFLSYEDYARAPKPAKLKVDEIKDIDSLLRAAGECFVYTGSKVLGNSSNVSKSENIIDSNFVFRSSEILRCEYVAYSSLVRDSKYLFGLVSTGTCSFCMQGYETPFSQRCFECNTILYSADAYYSNNCRNCQDIFFCFDQISKRFAIGNNELPRENYIEMKKSLLSQMAGELERKKRLPLITDLIRGKP